MRSRWNDADTAALSGVDLLVYASRLVGAETSLVVWGGLHIAGRDPDDEYPFGYGKAESLAREPWAGRPRALKALQNVARLVSPLL